MKRDGKSSTVSVCVSLMLPGMTLQQMPNNCKMPKCSLYFLKIKHDISIVSLICCGSHQSVMTGILMEKVQI